MIDRYTPRDMAVLWSTGRRYASWLDIELTSCESMERAGLVPAGVSRRISEKSPKIDIKRIEDIERIVKHDVIAFLTYLEEQVGEDARWLHCGMTSSDVVDTSFAILLRDALTSIELRIDKVLSLLAVKAHEHVNTPIIGRSHGVHAEPMTFGLVLSSHHAELSRSRTRIRTAKSEISVGKLSGAVGTYAHLSPEIEEWTLKKLGLTPDPISTQVISRDRHASVFTALGILASSIERFATNVRHWQRTEVMEVEESFSIGQKGSSAMPHKRNPILSENLCGLARIMRSYITPALENISLWHERDISHSSVERLIAPDATSLMAFMLDRLAYLIESMVVNVGRMSDNLGMTGGLFFSEGVMLELVRCGVPRKDAYIWVQRNAMRSWTTGADFLDSLINDPDIRKHMMESHIRKCFDLKHVLRHVETLVERAVGKE